MFGRIPINPQEGAGSGKSGGKTVEGMIGGLVAMSITRTMIRPLPWHPTLLLVDLVVSAVEAVNGGGGNDNIIMPLTAFVLS